MSFKQFVAAFGTVGKTKISAFWASLAIMLTFTSTAAVFAIATVAKNSSLPNQSSLLNESWDTLLEPLPLFAQIGLRLLFILLMFCVITTILASMLANWEGITGKQLDEDSIERQTTKSVLAVNYLRAIIFLLPAAFVLFTGIEIRHFTNAMLLTITFSAGFLCILCYRAFTMLKTRLEIVS